MKLFFPILLVAGLLGCEAQKPPQISPGTFSGQTPGVSKAETPPASLPASGTPQAPAGPEETGPAFPAANATATYSYQIIPAENATFGYEIKQNDRVLIRQATVPGMPGNTGFPTREKAGKAADLVLTKLKKGEMPPTVSETELRQAGAL